MIRVQICLTRYQYEYLKECSSQTGESISSMIRRAIEHLRKLEPLVKSGAQESQRIRGGMESEGAGKKSQIRLAG
jgi:hypothetical protein